MATILRHIETATGLHWRTITAYFDDDKHLVNYIQWRTLPLQDGQEWNVTQCRLRRAPQVLRPLVLAWDAERRLRRT